METDSERRRLLLIGGGHAHLAVLRDRAFGGWPAGDCTLISPDPLQGYSGMIAGVLRGRYEPRQAQVDLPALCEAAGTRWQQGRVVALDAVAGEARLEGGGRVGFDVASLDVGSGLAGEGLSGVREHAWPVRPLAEALRLRAQVDQLCTAGGPVAVVFVGGGAAGIEVASAIDRRIRDQGAEPRLTLVEAGPDLLEGHGSGARRRARRHLDRRGIILRTGARVEEVREEGVVLTDGETVTAAVVVWATGAAPHPLIQATNLATSDRGYIQVDATLQATTSGGTRRTPATGGPSGTTAGERALAPRIFGAGDCVDLVGEQLPRSGVYAVREGEVLKENLRMALAGVHDDDLERYPPQRRALSLLDTADGRSILSWGGLGAHSRIAWWTKDWIDTRFIQKYQRLER